MLDDTVFVAVAINLIGAYLLYRTLKATGPKQQHNKPIQVFHSKNIPWQYIFMGGGRPIESQTPEHRDLFSDSLGKEKHIIDKSQMPLISLLKPNTGQLATE